DLDRLGAAWRRLIARHDMLRAVVLPNGQQQILPEVPPYRIETLDLRGADAASAVGRTAALRSTMSHRVLPSERWPLFEIRATLLDGARTVLHFGFDALILDARSLRLLFAELRRVYDDPQTVLPDLDLSFRDYVLA